MGTDHVKNEPSGVDYHTQVPPATLCEHVIVRVNGKVLYDSGPRINDGFTYAEEWVNHTVQNRPRGKYDLIGWSKTIDITDPRREGEVQ